MRIEVKMRHLEDGNLPLQCFPTKSNEKKSGFFYSSDEIFNICYFVFSGHDFDGSIFCSNICYSQTKKSIPYWPCNIKPTEKNAD